MIEQTSRVGRERILEVAQELFTEYGFQGTSIRSIANACGITNAALYYYFSSKEDLFREVMRRYTISLREQVKKAGEGKESDQERITAMAQEYVNLVSNQRSMFSLTRSRKEGLERKEAQSKISEWLEFVLEPFEEVIQDAIARGTLKPISEEHSPASMLMGLLHGMFLYRKICHQKEIRKEDIRIAVDVFWNGMCLSS